MICGPCKNKDSLNLLSLIPKFVESQQTTADELRKLSNQVLLMAVAPKAQAQSFPQRDVLQKIKDQKRRETNLVVFELKDGGNAKNSFIKL